ncbi:MAG: hypothetical protein EA341_09970 [Mongoliibacter sp.]|uniref:hypothetical protein n=1 Tax=Mongoliibacter sp. TaxID=2022438 RepID=UPI0012EF2C6A|nr:hypothetical protein [Mongoliibacter sp.]TVP48995.1 MAG: hypothetical protein EA341_09970 [Mongoliibacter sp.]
MMKRFFFFPLILLILGSCSCDPEKMMKGMVWGLNKMAGEGYFPSEEILEFGEFERVEVNMNRTNVDGKNYSYVQLRFFNGKNPNLQYNQENIALRCAELYAQEYSKIKNYKEIQIVFIQSDPINPDNFAMNEYSFNVQDLLKTENPTL